MIYKKNSSKELDLKLFENPTSEYRGTPFWSWNCKLEESRLRRQIGYLQDMGFGGFHMHSRRGMGTEYLGEDFMNMVKACTDEAKKREMLSWLYDEDTWPSGFAGGYVTKNPVYRKRYITLLHESAEFKRPILEKDEALLKGEAYHVASFDVELNSKGEILSYKKIGFDEKAVHEKWNFLSRAMDPVGRFNDETYVDILNKDAIDEFIKITHEKYYETVGEEFGKVVPAIFTDEPQCHIATLFKHANSVTDTFMLAWTPNAPEMFKEAYGYDIVEKLPELAWNLAEGKISKARYHFYDFLSESFAKAFNENIGEWCDKHGIALTGHLMHEDNLSVQTAAVVDCMRQYKGYGLPGIDTLSDKILINTAKQAQSASHQYGREGVLSELYGVTGWEFDFRGHKAQGDWEAALGVTVRVPHLAWVSMAGDAKRDYPASIFYQSPWYKEYKYIEDHFSRVNTAITRGKPYVKIGVIHPVESRWINMGPADCVSTKVNVLEDNFAKLANWLTLNTLDFDYICEATLPELYKADTAKSFTVGEMSYTTVIVPVLETIRSTTLRALESFIDNGGRVIFLGECPAYVDASDDNSYAKKVYAKASVLPFSKTDILDALECERFIEISDSTGAPFERYLSNIRDDGDCYWAFLGFGVKTYANDNRNGARAVQLPQGFSLKIKVAGEVTPELYNTLNGKVEKVSYKYENGNTYIYRTVSLQDSLLLKLNKCKGEGASIEDDKPEGNKIILSGIHEYTLDEPNVLILDKAQFSLDGGEFEPEEEILRLDSICRRRINMKTKGEMPQPWVYPDEKSGHYITLKFNFDSDIEYEGAKIAMEDAEKHEITFNGEKLTAQIDGWYVDEDIKTFPIPKIVKGTNELIVKLSLDLRSNTENCYVLGDFGVKVMGSIAKIVEKEDKIGYAPTYMQSLPFYSGNIVYHNEIETGNCDLYVQVSYYKGALVKVYLDGEDVGNIVFSPYRLKINDVKAGKHKLDIKLFGYRLNTFGGLHNTIDEHTWQGPFYFRSNNEEWSYEYMLRKMGILSAPVVTIKEKA